MSTVNIEIKNFEKKNKAALVALFNLNVPKYFDKSEESDFISYLASQTEIYLIAMLNNEIVGCGGINYSKTEKKTGVLSWDMVHPNKQGLGIGKALTKHRIQLLKQTESIERIIVRTSQHTDGFYQKMGFKLCYIKKDFWAPGIDMYYMDMIL